MSCIAIADGVVDCGVDGPVLMRAGRGAVQACSWKTQKPRGERLHGQGGEPRSRTAPHLHLHAKYTGDDIQPVQVLVAASDASETYTTFTGLTRLQRGQTPTGAPLDASHPLSRSATLSTRQADQNPSRLSRSNTFAATSSLTPLRPVMPSASPASASASTSSPALGLADRALPGRPTPGRALTTSMPQSVRESIPISNEPPTLPLKLDTIKSTAVPQRKGSADSTGSNPGLAAYSGGGFGAASPPTEILRTPDERIDGGRGRPLRVTELYDDYYKSAGAYDDDIPELPPIGGKKIEAWAKKTAAAGPPSSFPPSYTSSPPESSGKGLGLTRGPSNASRRGFGLARSESRVGTNAESRYDDDGSDAGSFYDMVKIRVKVGAGCWVSIHRLLGVAIQRFRGVAIHWFLGFSVSRFLGSSSQPQSSRRWLQVRGASHEELPAV